MREMFTIAGEYGISPQTVPHRMAGKVNLPAPAGGTAAARCSRASGIQARSPCGRLPPGIVGLRLKPVLLALGRAETMRDGHAVVHTGNHRCRCDEVDQPALCLVQQMR